MTASQGEARTRHAIGLAEPSLFQLDSLRQSVEQPRGEDPLCRKAGRFSCPEFAHVSGWAIGGASDGWSDGFDTPLLRSWWTRSSQVPKSAIPGI